MNKRINVKLSYCPEFSFLGYLTTTQKYEHMKIDDVHGAKVVEILNRLNPSSLQNLPGLSPYRWASAMAFMGRVK
jgi:hypothetical protein